MSGRKIRIRNMGIFRARLRKALENPIEPIELITQNHENRLSALESRSTEKLAIWVAVIGSAGGIIAGIVNPLVQDVVQDPPAIVQYNCIDERSKVLEQYREFPGAGILDYSGPIQDQCQLNQAIDLEIERAEEQLQLPPGS